MTRQRLSERQCQIARLMLDGQGPDEIAELLLINPTTVKDQAKRIGVRTRAPGLRWAEIAEHLREIDRAGQPVC